MVIVKGAQYSVAFVLKNKNNGRPITSDDVDGVRIALGNQVATYPDGTLTYSTEDSTWLFPMTQTNTRALVGQTVDYQVEIRTGNDIFPSAKQSCKLKESMFRERWIWDTQRSIEQEENSRAIAEPRKRTSNFTTRTQRIEVEIGIAPVFVYPPYTGGYEVTPTSDTQVLLTEGKVATENITINPIEPNYGDGSATISYRGTRVTLLEGWYTGGTIELSEQAKAQLSNDNILYGANIMGVIGNRYNVRTETKIAASTGSIGYVKEAFVNGMKLVG